MAICRNEVGYINDLFDEIVELNTVFDSTQFFDCSVKNYLFEKW